MTNRKRVRAATSGENSGNNSEADDDDHEEEKDTKQRRKNPALREFQRLNSIDEQSDAHSSRNLRLWPTNHSKNVLLLPLCSTNLDTCKQY